MAKKKIGLALSGGGARGIAHLGVIKAFKEKGIEFDIISGTSAGAIIGALYADGYSTNDILKILLDIKPFKFLQPALNSKGLLKMELIQKFLEDYLPHNSFESLKKPLYVAVTNIRTGESEYFSKGELIPVICASSCIPVLFNPIQFNDEKYIDGGILNNLPAEVLKDKVNTVVGIHSNPIDRNFVMKNFSNALERALMLAITRNVYLSASSCDYLIEPKGLEPFKVMDIGKANEIFKIGYEQGLMQIEEQNIINEL